MKQNSSSSLMNSILVIILIICVCIATVVTISDTTKTLPRVESKLNIPEGYTFLDASAYGRISSFTTWYCQENSTGKIFICSDGVIKSQLVFPDGYQFLGASAYGDISSFTTYYCLNTATQEVFVCVPEIVDSVGR